MAGEPVVYEERIELTTEDVQYLCDVLDKMIAAAEETVERLDRINALLEETHLIFQAAHEELIKGESRAAVQSHQ
jgi:hypothetical protein